MTDPPEVGRHGLDARVKHQAGSLCQRSQAKTNLIWQVTRLASVQNGWSRRINAPNQHIMRKVYHSLRLRHVRLGRANGDAQ